MLERALWFPTREGIARAWLIGMPVTAIPFLPLQSLVACGIGFLAKANLPLCFALQYLSNPATAFIQIPACYFVGRLLMGAPISLTLHQIRTHPLDVLSGKSLLALYLGAFVLGPLLGALGYLLTHLVWRDKKKSAAAKSDSPVGKA